MAVLESIVLGVVSGILTSAFLFLISVLVKNQIIPWYQALKYQGVDINGIWIAEV